MRTPKVLKRKRAGVTDYSRRLRLVKSGKPRLVVRPSGKGILAQIVEYSQNGDHIIKTVTDRTLKSKGYEVRGNNISVSYLVGFTLANEIKDSGIEEVVLDAGRRNIVKGGRISAVVMGYVEGGGKVPCDKSIFPKEERIMGQHLQNKSAAETMSQVRKITAPAAEKKTKRGKKNA